MALITLKRDLRHIFNGQSPTEVNKSHQLRYVIWPKISQNWPWAEKKTEQFYRLCFTFSDTFSSLDISDLVKSLSSESESYEFDSILTPLTSQTRVHCKLTCLKQIICSILFLRSCCDGFILPKGDSAPLTQWHEKHLWILITPVISWTLHLCFRSKKIESLDNGSPSLCCQESAEYPSVILLSNVKWFHTKRWQCVVNPLSETCDN